MKNIQLKLKKSLFEIEWNELKIIGIEQTVTENIHLPSKRFRFQFNQIDVLQFILIWKPAGMNCKKDEDKTLNIKARWGLGIRRWIRYIRWGWPGQWRRGNRWSRTWWMWNRRPRRIDSKTVKWPFLNKYLKSMKLYINDKYIKNHCM